VTEPKQPEPKDTRRVEEVLEVISRKALDLAEQTTDLEALSKGVDIAKASAEAAKGYGRTVKFQFWVTTLAPLATVVGAVAALLFQNHQLTETLKAQSAQLIQASQLQQRAGEDAEWRDAIKGINYKDSSKALAGTMSMIGFLDVPRYADTARVVTVSLLPMVDNLEGFDDVMTALDGRTTNENQKYIIGVAQKVASIEWRLFNGSHYKQTNPKAIPFFDFQQGPLMIDISTPPEKRTIEEKLRIGAYEVDTVSHALFAIWKRDRKITGASPKRQNLMNVVLEDYDYSSTDFLMDFSDANLGAALLINAQFRGASFRGANFEDARLVGPYQSSSQEKRLERGVSLDNADLCEITQFARSDWSGANWWAAKCISPELRAYLSKNFPQNPTPSVRH